MIIKIGLVFLLRIVYTFCTLLTYVLGLCLKENSCDYFKDRLIKMFVLMKGRLLILQAVLLVIRRYQTLNLSQFHRKKTIVKCYFLFRLNSIYQKITFVLPLQPSFYINFKYIYCSIIHQELFSNDQQSSTEITNYLNYY